MWWWLVLALVACGAAPHTSTPQVKPTVDKDPDGPHAAAIAAQIQPWIDAEVISGIVVGIYDAGKLEIYGFGKGPGGATPTGKTLFEIGSVTKVYTSLLLADAVQRHEVSLETAVADLLPPGVTVPVRDKQVITLRHLALHSSGLPRLPPAIAAHGDAPDPYAGYGEEQLYADLVRTQLDDTPGSKIEYSNYGAGLLGFALGRKLGGFGTALSDRVLHPLGLADTYLAVPSAASARRATGTNTDLAPVPAWTFDALAGAGALISSARDQLALIDAELDAASGSKQPLRPAMRFTQEEELEMPEAGAPNEGLGWQIDAAGRFWHNGGTGGFHSFVGFDVKSRRGVVLLASTSTSVIDHFSDVIYKVLDGNAPKPPVMPTDAQLQPLVGHYDFQGIKLEIQRAGKRLYVLGEGSPKVRLAPISDHEFWVEELQSAAIAERDGDKIKRLVFVIGDKSLAAAKLD